MVLITFLADSFQGLNYLVVCQPLDALIRMQMIRFDFSSKFHRLCRTYAAIFRVFLVKEIGYTNSKAAFWGS